MHEHGWPYKSPETTVYPPRTAAQVVITQCILDACVGPACQLACMQACRHAGMVFASVPVALSHTRPPTRPPGGSAPAVRCRAGRHLADVAAAPPAAAAAAAAARLRRRRCQPRNPNEPARPSGVGPLQYRLRRPRHPPASLRQPCATRAHRTRRAPGMRRARQTQRDRQRCEAEGADVGSVAGPPRRGSTPPHSLCHGVPPRRLRCPLLTACRMPH
eukprot:195876-Chlamydomonas_euryale.AAC.4